MKGHSVIRIAVVAIVAAWMSASALSAEVPFLASRVNDYANMLSPAAIERLEQTLTSHEDSTTNQIVVLTIASLEGEVLEEFSIKVVEQWKLGTEKNDNGVLLLIVRDERKIRIEVGNGLEGVLPDGLCGTIIRHFITPHFKEGRFDDGIEAGVSGIIRAIGNEYIAEPEEVFIDTPPLPFALGIFAFFLFVVGIFTLAALFSTGFVSWFMYLFLIPFWSMFPIGLFGLTAGLIIFAVYAIGFIVLKVFFAKHPKGKAFKKKWETRVPPVGSGSSSGSRFGSSSSSSRSSFSGGGGSFSGGGSSGGW